MTYILPTQEQQDAEYAYWHPLLSDVEDVLIARGYRYYAPGRIDRYSALWQRRSGVEREQGGETKRGSIDIHIYDFRAHGFAMSYAVGATFETPHGWLKAEFYSLNGRNLLDRLPTLENEIKGLQERLMGEEVRSGPPHR